MTLFLDDFGAGGNRPTQMEGRRQRFNDLSDGRQNFVICGMGLSPLCLGLEIND
jgi:hypothetical protein